MEIPPRPEAATDSAAAGAPAPRGADPGTPAPHGADPSTPAPRGADPGTPAPHGADPSTPAPQGAGPGIEWAALDRASKRERLLTVAAEMFARDGVQTPIAEVARAAGAGVASVYRLFGSKDELLAALLTQRRDQIAAAAQEALERPGGHWIALREMLVGLAEQQSATDYLGEARVTLAEHPDVAAARRRMMSSLERLVAAARDEGRLRGDATALDLRLVLIAARAARRAEPLHWRRMVQLMIDGLDVEHGR